MRPDRVTKQDKKLEGDMASALGKENFYGEKKPVMKLEKLFVEKKPSMKISKVIVVKKTKKPLSAKQREDEMVNALEKEDFYGEKKAADFMKKKVSDAVRDAQSEKIIEEMKKRGFGKAGRLGAAKKS